MAVALPVPPNINEIVYSSRAPIHELCRLNNTPMTCKHYYRNLSINIYTNNRKLCQLRFESENKPRDIKTSCMTLKHLITCNTRTKNSQI